MFLTPNCFLSVKMLNKRREIMTKTDKYTKMMKAFNEKIEQKENELNALRIKRNNFMINAFEEMADKNDIPLPDAFDKFISVISSVSEDEELSEEILEDEAEDEFSELEKNETDDVAADESDQSVQGFKNYNK